MAAWSRPLFLALYKPVSAASISVAKLSPFTSDAIPAEIVILG
jgi:hypothetical protein